MHNVRSMSIHVLLTNNVGGACDTYYSNVNSCYVYITTIHIDAKSSHQMAIPVVVVINCNRYWRHLADGYGHPHSYATSRCRCRVALIRVRGAHFEGHREY